MTAVLPYLHKHCSYVDSLVTYTLVLTDNGHPEPTWDSFHSCQCRILKRKTKSSGCRHLSCFLPLNDENLIYSFHFITTLSSRKRTIPLYYMEFSRHVSFAILRCAYFTTLKFRDFAKFCILNYS